MARTEINGYAEVTIKLVDSADSQTEHTWSIKVNANEHLDSDDALGAALGRIIATAETGMSLTDFFWSSLLRSLACHCSEDWIEKLADQAHLWEENGPPVDVDLPTFMRLILKQPSTPEEVAAICGSEDED